MTLIFELMEAEFVAVHLFCFKAMARWAKFNLNVKPTSHLSASVALSEAFCRIQTSLRLH